MPDGRAIEPSTTDSKTTGSVGDQWGHVHHACRAVSWDVGTVGIAVATSSALAR